MKPILFNTEMVRAILDGRKTVTRRVIKPQPELYGLLESHWDWHAVKRPYQPGDILYVRETWDTEPVTPGGHFCPGGVWYYKADGDLRPEDWRGKWHPSIHMPKEAARIFLRVTDVRVERVKDITINGLQNEGIVPHGYLSQYTVMTSNFFEEFKTLWDSTIKPADRALYGWAANPWVWVIEFELVGEDEARG